MYFYRWCAASLYVGVWPKQGANSSSALLLGISTGTVAAREWYHSKTNLGMRLLALTVVYFLCTYLAHSVSWATEHHCSHCHHVLPGFLRCCQPCLLRDEGGVCSKLQVHWPRWKQRRGIGLDGVASTHNFQAPLQECTHYCCSLWTAFFLLLCAGPPSKCMHVIHVSCEYSSKWRRSFTSTSSLSLFSLSLFSLSPSSCHWSSKLYRADVCYQSRVCWYHCWYVCQPLASSLPLPSLPLIPASSSPTSCSSSHHHLPTSLSLSLPITPLISTPLPPPDSCDDTSVCLSVDPCTCHSLGWCVSSPHLPPGEHTCDLLECTRVCWLDFVWFIGVH